MDFTANNFFQTFTNELPDDQPPATSYPEPGQMAPLNPTPDVPGPNSPEVERGSSIDPDANKTLGGEDLEEENADD